LEGEHAFLPAGEALNARRQQNGNGKNDSDAHTSPFLSRTNRSLKDTVSAGARADGLTLPKSVGKKKPWGDFGLNAVQAPLAPAEAFTQRVCGSSPFG